ncbi:pyridoxal phosphate-dependent aminotransferase [Prochlorococcus sp. MIT 1341]|uniref:pyridoxal phosphate-dependent aminotransferase n=1 Tax=Prochlorococcus sp. MIT 1341 TaxID=3096221 RepID=UPI002A74983F|nr:pyridoxal phosphate-dependent aminotransferase [Prochlorococcus sp. MIT 1341]
MDGRKPLSQRALALTPSLTLEISARAKALANDGRDICSLSAGEPDFPTPPFIVEAAIKALKDGLTKYGPSAGDPELREAIAHKITNVNDIPTSPNQVLVTNGGKQAIYNLLQIIINPSDEVIIPAPYWLSYPEMVKLSGGKPIICESTTSQGFELNIEKLESLITTRTKLLVLNSPGNPTGRVMNRTELENIANLLRHHPNIYILSDEIYEFLLAENQTHNGIATVARDLEERTFIVNGFAKTWAMTGWRVGYLRGNIELIKAASALQSQSTSNVCSFAQKGALAALTGPTSCIKYMVDCYNQRRNILISGLRKIPGINLVSPDGAFYAFPELPLGTEDSVTFCKKALEHQGLAIVPGAAFGNDRCIRISCASSIGNIEDGLSRLKRSLSNY